LCSEEVRESENLKRDNKNEKPLEINGQRRRTGPGIEHRGRVRASACDPNNNRNFNQHKEEPQIEGNRFCCSGGLNGNFVGHIGCLNGHEGSPFTQVGSNRYSRSSTSRRFLNSRTSTHAGPRTNSGSGSENHNPKDHARSLCQCVSN